VITTTLNSNIHYNSEQYKDCAGKDCKHKGTTLLRIKYLQKKGYFCDSCAADLLQSEIAVKEGGLS
jgi:hypothetical protein